MQHAFGGCGDHAAIFEGNLSMMAGPYNPQSVAM